MTNPVSDHSLTPAQQRDAKDSVIMNAFYWALGNGLISTSLIVYLVYDLCREEKDFPVRQTIAWIIAAPRIVGLLRLLTPTLIDLFGSRKRLCVCSYALSPLVLLAIPLGMPRLIHAEGISLNWTLFLIAATWCVYHVIEYFGTMALWSAVGDLIPQEQRAPFLGKREAMMVFGRVLGFFFTGLYSYFVINALPAEQPKWTGYLLPTYLGVFFLVLACVPLISMAEIPWKKEPLRLKVRVKQLLEPLRSRRFAVFVFFGIWLQLPGFMQSEQYHYLVGVLAVPLLALFSTQMLTQLGQCGLGASFGKWIKRFGHFRVMCVSIVLVSSGQMFYFFAEKSTWWLVFGAAFVWIFWVGVNIGISSLVLNLSPPEQKASGVSLFYSMSTLSFGIATLLGGRIADQISSWQFPIWFLGPEIYWDYAHYAFFLGSFLRLSSIVVLYFAMKVEWVGDNTAA